MPNSTTSPLKEDPQTETKQPVWLMSFADFAGCLLASFVLLYSLAQTDREKMQAAFGVAVSQANVDSKEGIAEKSMATRPSDEGRDTDYLANLLATKLEKDIAFDGVELTPLSDNVVLELPLTRLKTTPDLAEEHQKDLIFALAGLLAVTPNDAVLSVDLPQEATGAHWTKGIMLANALAQRLRDSGAPEILRARTIVSADENAHIRLVLTREAGDE